ncbi:hypothetical protein SSX86_006342 [Deinandra increscens subsp. villosa]|uniref:Protein phosphatase 2C n=1 Tax=Deinandra increscens subsp. villosa TaxID=3103831 RepID=A0AAP0DMJ0_9ASTR
MPMELSEDGGDLNHVDSSELSSTSSTVSSIFGGSSDVDLSSSSFSIASSSSDEILAAAVVPVKLGVEQHGGGEETKRLKKCVGRNKGVTWGFKSVIGRRKEMEDAVAVVPGFMSRTCHHVGGCTTPGSRTSLEISPIHFFAVYDGHGGSQVSCLINSQSVLFSYSNSNRMILPTTYTLTCS